MQKMINNLMWYILEIRRKMLIPDAFFDEKKRVKMCRIDQRMIELKRKEGNFNGGKKDDKT